MTTNADWFLGRLEYNWIVSPCDARDPLDGFEPTQITRGQTPCGCERLAVFQKQGTLCSHLLRQVQKLRQGTTLWGDYPALCPAPTSYES